MEALTINESDQLMRCERDIEANLGAADVVFRRLKEIHDARLYKARYVRFEDYVRERWGKGKSWAMDKIRIQEIRESAPTLPPETRDNALLALRDVPEEEREAVIHRAQARNPIPTKEDVETAAYELLAERLEGAIAAGPAQRTAREPQATETREERAEKAAAIRKHLAAWPAKMTREVRRALEYGIDPRKCKELVAMHAELGTMLAGRG